MVVTTATSYRLLFTCPKLSIAVDAHQGEIFGNFWDFLGFLEAISRSPDKIWGPRPSPDKKMGFWVDSCPDMKVEN
jgi:hypothetical protein